jgi:transposase-like protein
MTAPEAPNAESGANSGEGELLSGTVIVDETLLGTAGKEKNPALAVVALEQNGETALNRVRIKAIKDGGKNTLKAFINESIAKGSKVITDGWPGYRGLEVEGYIHEVDAQNRPNLETAMFDPVCSIVSNIRQWLSSRYQGAVSPKHLQNYLNEYAFIYSHYNHQETWEEAHAARFEQMLKNALRIEPVTYKKLTNPGEYLP